MRRRAIGGVLLVVGLVAAAFPVRGQSTPDHLTPEFLASIDDALLHGTVTPPGAAVTEKEKELRAYDDLVGGYPNLTETEITTKYFKDGRFQAVTDVEREYRPRADVRIVRDTTWGVPHIYGNTDAAAAFGAGYAAVEDRLPIIMLLIALGRAEAFELLGTGEAWLADAEIARLYGYTEAEFQAMIDRMPAVYGQDGQDLIDLLAELVQGLNAAVVDVASGRIPVPAGFADLGVPLPAPFTSTDVVAIVSIIRALFGAGGGNEMGNASRWLSLVDQHGPAKARAIWDDFRNRTNADGVVHTTKSFPYNARPGTVDADAHAFGFGPGDSGLDGVLGGLFPTQAADLAEQSRIKWERIVLDTPAGRVDLSSPGHLSNYLVVDGRLSATGRPILLGGPQAGYFDPQILVENELHGDRLHARGAGFPGMGFVVIGRNAEAAWTPTAGGSDMIDTYVEVLCDPEGGTPTEDSTHYLFKGECLEMDRRVVRTVTDDAPIDLPGRDALPDIIVERTVHGTVVARGRVGEQAVAVSRKRSTYGKELDAGVSILKLNRNEVPDGKTFVDTFEESHNLSTNWAFANRSEIAYVHGGLYPERPSSVDPDLPVWGTGEWEWAQHPDGTDRFLTTHPHEVAPARGYLVSWNNRPAPDWGASDAQWGWSSLYRADMLEDQILREQPGTITPVRMVQMMEQAGLTDFRGSHVLPLALRVLDAVPAPGPREQRMRAVLADWVANGALRRDGDGDGNYDKGAAVAIMDAWWAGLIRSVFDPALGDVTRATSVGFDNAPSSTGSAYQDGFYGQLWTDLSMVLGDAVRAPTSQVYCGSDAAGTSGTLAACAARLWASLAAAGDALGGTDPDAWNADAAAERITFLPNASLSMHWVNRPTTQGIAMFGRQQRGAPAPPPAVQPAALPSTGAVPPLGLGALLLLIAGAIRRQHLALNRAGNVRSRQRPT
jgi:acyl-homoserine lactone acylase PvdQ